MAGSGNLPQDLPSGPAKLIHSRRHASATPVRLKARPQRQSPTIKLDRNQERDASGGKSKVCSARNSPIGIATGSNSPPAHVDRKPEKIQHRMNGAKIRPKV